MNNASLILDKIAANIIRNTKAIDIYRELREYDIEVDVYDPWANPAEVMHEYGIKTITQYPEGQSSLSLVEGGYAAIILAVAHNEFMSINLQKHKDNGCMIYDVKGILDKQLTQGRL